MINKCIVCNKEYKIPDSRWKSQSIKIPFCNKQCKNTDVYKTSRDNYLLRTRGYPMGYNSLMNYNNRPRIINKKCHTCKLNFETKRTSQIYCSKICLNASLPRIEKIKLTKKKKYNDMTFNNREKAKITCYDRYGVGNPMQNQLIKQKGIDTLNKKYGESNISKTLHFKNKYKEVMQRKYGVDNYFQRTDVMKQHYCDSLGYPNPRQSSTSKIWLAFRDSPSYKEFLNIIHNKHNKSLSRMAKRFRCDSGTLKKDFIKLGLDYRNESITMPEQEIYEFLKRNITDDVVLHDRHLGKELDLYIPSRHFAIEYHGNYWHSYNYVPNTNERQQHLKKYMLCKDNGIFLLQIFEDEWENKKSIIKSMILSKLNLIKNRIHARKCIINYNIDRKTINNFIDMNHIQGICNFNKSICLIYDNEVVSVLLFMGNELVRFCSKAHFNIPGAFSKLMAHCNINGEIKTFSDNRYSNGMVYLKNGFALSNPVSYSYWYLDKNTKTRLNRRRFQKKKLQIPANITEMDYVINIMKHRVIFDAGKQTYKINT